MIIDPSQIKSDIEEKVDVCVVGSGAGGAVIAKELAEAGHSVIVLEKGGNYTSEDFIQKEDVIHLKTYEQGMARITTDFSVMIVQGTCVGGGTTINDAVCYRTPKKVLEKWTTKNKVLGYSERELKRYFDKVGEIINAEEIDDFQINKNNKKLKHGCEKMQPKWDGHPVTRAQRGCKNCGFCHLGCRYNAKQSMLVTYIPMAINYGATIYTRCRAIRILMDKNPDANGREKIAKKVEGIITDPENEGSQWKINIEAKVIIVASGAINSSQLLLNSGIKNDMIGKSLSLHPFPYMFADFDEKINGFQGLPIGYSCTEFSVLQKHDTPGYLIEGIFEMPSLYGIFLPSFGLHWKKLMDRYTNYASAMMVLHDEANGRVSVNKRGDVNVKYTLSDKDKGYLREAIKNAAKIYFAAGAKRIITSHIKETIIEREEDIDNVLDKAGFGTGDIILISAHPQGGNIMGGKRLNSVVDSNLESHEVSNLFVTDGSVFPSSIGVNPQFTIMAFATKTAEYINNKGVYFK